MRLRRVLVAGSVTMTSACSLLVDLTHLSTDVPPDASADSASPADSASSADSAPDASDASTLPDGAPARCGDAGTDPSIVLYLPFDDNSATTADCSGHGHDGTVLGGSSTVPGHTGNALAFDGLQTCVYVGTPADLVLQGPFTVTAWARVDEYQLPAPANDARTFVAKTTSTQSRGWRFVSDGVGNSTSVGFKIGTASGTTFTLPSPSPQPVATWIHVAGVWVPNGQASIYVDGAAVASSAVTTIIEDTAAAVYVGCVRPGSQPFKGALDEFRVYSRALTPAEIAALAK